MSSPTGWARPGSATTGVRPARTTRNARPGRAATPSSTISPRDRTTPKATSRLPRPLPPQTTTRSTSGQSARIAARTIAGSSGTTAWATVSAPCGESRAPIATGFDATLSPGPGTVPGGTSSPPVGTTPTRTVLTWTRVTPAATSGPTSSGRSRWPHVRRTAPASSSVPARRTPSPGITGASRTSRVPPSRQCSIGMTASVPGGRARPVSTRVPASITTGRCAVAPVVSRLATAMPSTSATSADGTAKPARTGMARIRPMADATGRSTARHGSGNPSMIRERASSNPGS